MAKILLIEDDVAYANLIGDVLGAEHVLDVAATANDAKAYLSSYSYELLVVDWELPDTNGPDFIRSLRANGEKTPILMLTVRDKLDDKARGFSTGADDYLAKSADPREILMRVKALLRRPAAYINEILKVRDIEIDTDASVVRKAGVEVYLRPKELTLLEYLVKNRTRAFTADELLNNLWPSDTEATIQTVRSSINRIRTKLDDSSKPSLIQTKYGTGYQLAGDD